MCIDSVKAPGAVPVQYRVEEQLPMRGVLLKDWAPQCVLQPPLVVPLQNGKRGLAVAFSHGLGGYGHCEPNMHASAIHMAVGQHQWYHFGLGEFTTHFRTYFSGWIGMFTANTIWILTHSHIHIPEVPFFLKPRASSTDCVWKAPCQEL